MLTISTISISSKYISSVVRNVFHLKVFQSFAAQPSFDKQHEPIVLPYICMLLSNKSLTERVEIKG